MHFFISCIWLLALLLCSRTVAGQVGFTNDNSGFTITKRLLSIEAGLASHDVFCGVQDKAGFLWFGTRNGLNRYDGKNCLLFTRQRNNLQDNKVVQLAKDDDANLFIEYGNTGFQLATNGKIDVMNALTHEVKTLTAAFPNMPFKEENVYWISNDGTGEINFLTSHPFRLWKYSSKQGFQLRFEMGEWNRQDGFSVADYHSTGTQCVFANGKALIKLSNLATQYLVLSDTVIAFIQKDALRSLPFGFNSENDVLITYNTRSSSAVFDVGMVTHKGQNRFPAYATQINADSIKGKYWYQHAVCRDGGSCAFYIATDALYLWNENAFLRIISKPELKAFENLFVYQLFSDNNGHLWLCTSLGVLQLKIEKNRFTQYFTSSHQNIETNSQARGIYADGSRRLMANIWRHSFLQQGDDLQNIPDDEIHFNESEIKYALTLHHSALYCGGSHLFCYNEKDKKLLRIPGSDGTEIWSMSSINDSLLLLGRTGGFSLFNSNSKKFDSLLYTSIDIAAAKFVYRFFKDEKDTLWAVAENGLFKIIQVNGQWSVMSGQWPMVSNLPLLDIHSDTNGIFWIATNGEGLYRWNRKTNSFQQFNIANGFPSDVLYRIESDAYNNLWISSDYGLIRFNAKTFSVKTYTTADGISHNEFNRISSFKANDGRLFFGGLDGVNAFDPKDFITDTNALNSPLRVIAFNQFVGSQNSLVNRTNELLNHAQIILAPGDQFFTLEFQLLNFSKDEVQRYAYKIDGVDKDWNYISENSIRISRLPFGKFTLHIKAQNREGAWSNSELNIPLFVLKPFYLEWWFISIAVLLAVAMIYRIIKWRTKQLADEKIKLEKTVNERTAQLKQSLTEQAELLTEKDVLMKEVHHRVKNNLQVISGLLELQSNALDDEAAKNALREGRSRVRSIALIHQNLYQFENLNSIELKRFVHDLCRQIESVFKKQNKTAINISVPDMYLDIDSAVPLGLILNELLSNSFKYAFSDKIPGQINIEINNLASGKYELIYTDNGPGLPADFDVNKATTLGIQLINDLSRQIGGKVKYAYTGKAVFTIHFTNRSLRKNED